MKLIIILALINLSFGTEDLSIAEIFQHLEKRLFGFQLETIRPTIVKAKLEQDAFKKENDAAIDEFMRLNTSGVKKEDLLLFAQAKAAAAKAQIDSYDSLIASTKRLTNANLTLPKYLYSTALVTNPENSHLTGFVANPRSYNDWMSRIKVLEE